MCHFHLPTHTRLTELHFRTRDLGRALRFYSETLGFKIVERTELSAAFSAPQKTSPLIRFTLDHNATERQPDETGLSHFAIRFPTRTDLVDIARKLASQHKECELTAEPIRVNDPDGNAIDLSSHESPGNNAAECENNDGKGRDNLVAHLKNEPQLNGTSPDARIGHINFTVENMRSAARFFRDYLGLKTTPKSEDSLSFTIVEGDQRIEVTERKETPRHAHNSVGLISYKIAVHCGEVLYALNQRVGIFGFESAARAKSSRLLRINDPLGFTLEVEAVEPERSVADSVRGIETLQRNSADRLNEMSLSTKSGWKARSPFFT